jgi:hypothetical protein
MCLDTISQKFDEEITFIESGWKYFNGAHISTFPHNALKGKLHCPLDQWLVAEGKDIAATQSAYKTYKAGFHIFTDEQKARKQFGSRIREVFFRHPTTIGVDQGIETVVAREMYVPSEQKGWPPKGS